MSIKEIPMFAVQCDEPGCKVDTQALENEFAAWSEQSWAEEEWTNSDQQEITDSQGATRHYCDEHRKPVCDDCEIQVPSVDDDGLCLVCAAKFAAQQASTPSTRR